VAFTKYVLDGKIKLSSKIFIDKAKIVICMKRILGHLFKIQHEQQLHLDECAAEMKRILIPISQGKMFARSKVNRKWLFILTVPVIPATISLKLEDQGPGQMEQKARPSLQKYLNKKGKMPDLLA
jgi:DNA-directed RNA polymerase beta' subunit